MEQKLVSVSYFGCGQFVVMMVMMIGGNGEELKLKFK